MNDVGNSSNSIINYLKDIIERIGNFEKKKENGEY